MSKIKYLGSKMNHKTFKLLNENGTLENELLKVANELMEGYKVTKVIKKEYIPQKEHMEILLEMEVEQV